MFKPLVIHHKIFDDIFLELLCRPDPETGGNQAFYAVSHRYNYVEIVISELPLNITTAFPANC